MKKCRFCERYFKNNHGLHIHWFYCFVKSFKEMPIEYVDNKKYKELMEDVRLIPLFRYHPKMVVKFARKGEFGMRLGKRYILEE